MIFAEVVMAAGELPVGISAREKMLTVRYARKLIEARTAASGCGEQPAVMRGTNALAQLATTAAIARGRAAARDRIIAARSGLQN